MKLPFAHYVKAHHISHAALSVGAVVAAIVFFTVGAGIRLLMGPVSLGPLQDTLAGAIRTALPGITLQYDKAGIEWDREQGRITLVVLGTRVLDQAGHVVVTAPKADIALAAAPFLKGEIAVQRITLVGVSFRLVHMKDGGIRVGGEGDPANDVYARLRDLIQSKGESTSTLKSFAVHNARLDVFDEVTGMKLTAPRTHLSVTATGTNLAIVLDADVVISGKTAHVKSDLLLPAGNGPISGNAAITSLDLAALGATAPLFQPLRALPLSTSLTTRFAILPGGHVSQSDFDVKASGDIPYAALNSKALHVQELRLTGHYDGLENRLSLSQASLKAREADVQLKGGAALGFDDKGALNTISADLAATRANFNMPGVLAGPVNLQTAMLRAVWHATERKFDIQRLSLTAPGLGMDIKGAVQMGQGDQSPGLELTGSLAASNVRTTLRYWPMQVAPSTREWIDGNLFAGTLGPAAFEAHFAPGMLDQVIWPDAALRLSFPMNGVEGRYLDGLTHLTQVSGTALLTGDTFSADFTGGRVGNLVVTNGHALIPTLHLDGTVGQFQAHVEGALPEIMTLIDMKPLGYPTRFGVLPRQTGGTASVDLDFKVPMLAKLAVDDIGISVKAGVQNFSIQLGRLHLTNGDVNFTVDNNRLRQTGLLNLADSRLNVDWVEEFNPSGAISTKVNVKGQVTDAGRAALNIGMANILTGPVGVNAVLEGARGSLRTADIQMDLTAAGILVPIVHLGKPAGQAASGTVHANFGPGDNILDETIRITGPGITAIGTANFDKTGVLTQLNFPTARLGTLTDMSFTMNRAGTLDTYTLRGRSMDGSLVGRDPNEKASTAPGVNASAPPPDETPSGSFRIDARLEKVSLRGGISIAPFALDLTGTGNRPGTLMLAGNLNQAGFARTAALSANIEAVPAGRKLTLNAADAGMLIRGMFAFDSLRGGRLALTATLPGQASDPETPKPEPDFQGKLDIDKFTMVDQPFLTRLFSAVSLTGLGDLMGGSGITVDSLDVPFSSKNSVISVKGARAAGPAIGASADGYIDRPKNQIALKGSLVPAYGLNSVLSNIPVLGDILASKKGEGILGVTYSATGNADQPSIATNPLSILTPGILRRIFEGHIPTAANAPSNAPGATAVVPPPVAANQAPTQSTPAADAPTKAPAQPEAQTAPVPPAPPAPVQ